MTTSCDAEQELGPEPPGPDSVPAFEDDPTGFVEKGIEAQERYSAYRRWYRETYVAPDLPPEQRKPGRPK